eukprot:TRINITY_DN6657_c0_g1_i2.p1 TRINITY_DN6657_c0_g1~~TRINITY_DN6657_c0_g1_i2.p1  ORF type:complete len:344 (+),score=66.62 TRINITY_DN6657_c0_g1_i2:31-1062(+)
MDALAEELSNVEENEVEQQEAREQLAHEESDGEEEDPEEEVPEFKQAYHIKYFKRCLDGLPFQYTSLDSNRLTLAYFCISGLDVLGALDDVIPDKSDYIDWIYSHQIIPDENTELSACGFRGGTYCGNAFNVEGSGSVHKYDLGHITMTYAALVTLRTLGDDLSRVHREGVLASLKALQQEDGSFSPVIGGSESDMRFLFCACAVSFLLDDWSGVDQDLATQYILASQTYEGAIAQGPSQEAHGGSTYCGLAALKLMNRLDELPNQDLLLRWYPAIPHTAKHTQCFKFSFHSIVHLPSPLLLHMQACQSSSHRVPGENQQDSRYLLFMVDWRLIGCVGSTAIG